VHAARLITSPIIELPQFPAMKHEGGHFSIGQRHNTNFKAFGSKKPFGGKHRPVINSNDDQGFGPVATTGKAPTATR
jgi:hypothetical protein